MNFVLECECGSNDFTYNEEDGFKCKECGNIYTDEDAGKHLLSNFEY